MDGIGDEHTAWLGEGFETCSHVHPIPENVLALDDHVPEVDADTELNPLRWQRTLVAFGHASLDLDRTSDGFDRALELRKEAVAGVLHHPAAVRPYFRVDQFPEMGLELLVGPLLIHPH